MSHRKSDRTDRLEIRVDPRLLCAIERFTEAVAPLSVLATEG